MGLKLDKQINLQQLILTVVTLVGTIMLFAFSLQGKVTRNSDDIKEIKQEQEKSSEKLDGKLEQIQSTLMEIQLTLKDKADREGN